MNKIALAAATIALGTLGACASAPQSARLDAAPAEIGYEPGSLGYTAIMTGDMSQAEAQLNEADPRLQNDPARLLNLAYVYQKTGRTDEARELYRRVLELNKNPELAMSNGQVRSTKTVARQALASID